MSESTTALSELTVWVADQLKSHGWQATAPLCLQPLTGDAGFRCYFRVDAGASMLAVLSPPQTENNPVFVSYAEFLRDQGVHAPQIIAVDYARGFLLLEDFGDQLYGSVINAANAELLYGEAFMSLLRMQQLPHVAVPSAHNSGEQTLGVYDQPTLRREMSLFHEWFIPQMLGHQLTSAEQSMLDRVYDLLENSALEQPQVWVHRDFHCRNLIHREGQAPGVIDFQDALWGPVTYDVVSLLRDCYVRWSPTQVRHWALTYANMACDARVMAPVSDQQFLRWFDLMGLQRHIKVLGIFARLSLRDDKQGYRKDLPLVIRYTLEVAANYPELMAFTNWFEQTLLPLCEQQPWYSDYRLAGDSEGQRS